MPDSDCLTLLLGIQGFRVVRVKTRIQNEHSEVTLELERTTKKYICSECGRELANAYDSRVQVVQHLSLWHHITYLRFKRYRVKCPDCGVRVESLDFVDKYARVTTALSSLVYELCKVMTCKAVALFQCLHRGTVKAIDKGRLQKAQKERPLDGITAIGIDEISVGKGHNYWHLISALCSPRGPELLYIGEGRKEKDIKRFWRWFGKKRTRQVKVAVMDMWKGFINSFKTHCPGICIIYDKFHIIRHLLEALNKVRKQELRGAGKRLKGLLVGKKFILLSRQAHIRGKARIALNELLSLSTRLLKAHLLKENLSHLWSYNSRTWACKFWQSWKDCLKWSRLKPYEAFARMIDKHLDGILAYCDHKVSLGFIEATNLKARNIIRRAYGYRDKEYMKLKIIQSCSPLGAFNPWTSIVTHYNSS
jgi:transposase